VFRAVTTIGFLAGLSVLAYFSVSYYGYYSMPLIDRPHSSLHLLAKPGGTMGHGFGVVGSAMILLLFLYSIRRRGILRWGSLTRWLNVHIIFGILGPLYVTLHSAFKFGGIICVSYYSMLAVMMSGIFGRYLYLQIPRALTGGELSTREIDLRKKELESLLTENYGLTGELIRKFGGMMGETGDEDRSSFSLISAIFVKDILRPFRFRAMQRMIRSDHPDLPPDEQDRIASRIKELVLLDRKIHYLDTTQRIFYYWHVIHRPFAIVMVLIMFIHIGVVTYYGYHWIF